MQLPYPLSAMTRVEPSCDNPPVDPSNAKAGIPKPPWSTVKLTILPSGKANGRATELLASDAMDQLLDELSTRYSDRIVVFDAPPLLPSTESRVLATYMGQVVVVVEADRTPQRSLSQALSTIESCPIVLPLLNKISRSEVGAYYGYYGPV